MRGFENQRGQSEPAAPSGASRPVDPIVQQSRSRRARRAQAADVRGGVGGTTHQKAAHGISGSGGPMPHGDRIQSSFGRHDISHVRAHTDAPAREANSAMGSKGYATPGHVAFAGEPDLETAAHEAAHSVQQDAGVSLPGGVGQAGDRHEQHADAVARTVVAGGSAEGLLDQYAGGGGGGGGGAVQARLVQFDPEDGGDGGDGAPGEGLLDAASVDAVLGPGSYAEWMATVERVDDCNRTVSDLRGILPAEVHGRFDAPLTALNVQSFRTYGAIESLVREHEESQADDGEGEGEGGGGGEGGGDAIAELDALIIETDSFEEVIGAWRAVAQARLWEMFARIGEERLERARTLRDTVVPGLASEIRAVQAQVRQYDEQLGEAFAQAGINATLAAASAIVGVMFPPLGIVMGIAAAGFAMWLDRELGPSGGGASDGAAVIGALPLRRMPAIGAALGAACDAMEIDEAIENYEQITALKARIRRLQGRWRAAHRELTRLQPFLQNAVLAQQLIQGMRAHAELLRGQAGG